MRHVSSATTFTFLSAAKTNGLGEIVLDHPRGTFALTPASEISIRAICDHHALLSGRGIDWGSGVGGMAIAAARIPSVDEVIGLELSEANVRAAKANAQRNSVTAKTVFCRSDSYVPSTAAARAKLESLAGRIQFVLANPPSSEGDDGFGFRRTVLRGALPYLAKGGVVFLSISLQYGKPRIARLTHEVPGYRHGGMLSSSPWVPFDLRRPDLLLCLEIYAKEEQRGGEPYAFVHPEHPKTATPMTAQAALACFHRTGLSPLTKWQVHLFRRTG